MPSLFSDVNTVIRQMAMSSTQMIEGTKAGAGDFWASFQNPNLERPVIRNTRQTAATISGTICLVPIFFNIPAPPYLRLCTAIWLHIFTAFSKEAECTMFLPAIS